MCCRTRTLEHSTPKTIIQRPHIGFAAFIKSNPGVFQNMTTLPASFRPTHMPLLYQFTEAPNTCAQVLIVSEAANMCVLATALERTPTTMGQKFTFFETAAMYVLDVPFQKSERGTEHVCMVKVGFILEQKDP
jgi:hypothetical protein